MGTGTGTGNLLFFLVVSEPVSEKFGTEKSPGTGLEKNLVPKKVPEPVSENFGTEKSIGTGLEKIWYRKKSRNRSRKILVPKKSLGIGIVQILGLVTHCSSETISFQTTKHLLKEHARTYSVQRVK